MRHKGERGDRNRKAKVAISLTVSSLMIALGSSPALSFDFRSDDLGTKFNAELVRLGQKWNLEKHDCSFVAPIAKFVCRYNLSNSIEVDAISKDNAANSNEVVLIWNGQDTFDDSFAYTLLLVGELCSPAVDEKERQSKIVTILPRPGEEKEEVASIPQRSVEIANVDYTSRVMQNWYLMVTVREK